MSSPSSSSWPALYLYPLNQDSFIKHISLTQNQRVKIGRQTNARTVPAENNGYFDSKVLSRQHAEVWEENGKIYIKDVKSSNGTFINGERLSPEGLESEPYELKSDDIVEFGIDIVGDDNKTIIHHKVAARVLCIFSEQDALVAARAEAHQQSHQLHHSSHPHPQSNGLSPSSSNVPGSTQSIRIPPGPGSNAANFSFAPGTAAQRRGPPQPQGLGGMGGMGQGFRPPGQKSGLTFDHILSRLQGELQKSKETGAELQNLTGALGDIHDTLGGTVPQNLPSFNGAQLPPVRPPQHEQPVASSSAPSTSETSPSSSLSPAVLHELQSQLHDTQSSLATHVDKVRALEGVFKEHEAIKREVSALRELVEHSRASSHSDHESAEGEGDDNDAHSITTVIPHELERVEEEDEEQLHFAEEESDDDRSRRRAELGRPRTPEPSSLGIIEDDESPRRNRERSSSPPGPTFAPGVDELTAKLTTLSNQLESALLLSSSLQAQHTAAQSTISALEQKVSQLENLVRTSTTEPTPAPTSVSEGERESLTQMLTEWKKGVEGQWTAVREEWASERERLALACEEWESKVKSVESNFGSASAKVDAGLASLALMQTQQRMTNGDAIGVVGFPGSRNMGKGSGGLVTPPSPRSLSADSNRPRRQRKKGSRGRSGSRSHSRSNSELEPEQEAGADSDASSIRRSCSPSLPGDSSSSEADADSVRLRKDSTDSKDSEQPLQLATPDSSVHRAPITSSPSSFASALAATSNSDPNTITTESERGVKGVGTYSDAHFTSISTVVGVLVLSVAAAAVLWRVKPE